MLIPVIVCAVFRRRISQVTKNPYPNGVECRYGLYKVRRTLHLDTAIDRIAQHLGHCADLLHQAAAKLTSDGARSYRAFLLYLAGVWMDHAGELEDDAALREAELDLRTDLVVYGVEKFRPEDVSGQILPLDDDYRPVRRSSRTPTKALDDSGADPLGQRDTNSDALCKESFVETVGIREPSKYHETARFSGQIDSVVPIGQGADRTRLGLESIETGFNVIATKNRPVVPVELFQKPIRAF